MRRVVLVLTVTIAVVGSGLHIAAAAGPAAGRARASGASGTTRSRHPQPRVHRPSAGTRDPRNVHHASAARSAGLAPELASFASISNGTLRLGINPEGHLNVNTGSESLGLQYIPTGS